MSFVARADQIKDLVQRIFSVGKWQFFCFAHGFPPALIEKFGQLAVTSF